MNKKHLRSIFLSLIIFLSVSSFVYLNCFAQKNLDPVNQALMLSEEQIETNEIEMPDLKIVNHIFKTVRRFLPAQ